MRFIFFATLSLVLFAACADNHSIQIDKEAKAIGVSGQASPFSDYWEQGQAEITTYELKQARYGELHEGLANTIFVTEPFSKSKQVKLDNPGSSASDNVHVLKMNFTRKFYTGVYPYSTMLSVFTPVDQKKSARSLKAVFGAQEWCGQTFSQLNLTPTGYNMEQFSYFESEGDKGIKLSKVLLEDEIWSMLRINPESLPTGEFKAIPGLTFTRLSHEEPGEAMAKGTLTKNGKVNTYSLYYPDFKRTLSITFEAEFPHLITSWEEKGYSGFGASKKELTTTATFKSRKLIDYWNKHDLKDAGLRRELGLE